MATYVLVHGAWGGAHGFHLVRPLLREQGHEVFTPSLTGIGERVHLASPQITLSTHVQDVVNHILYEDARDIVMLGFSYGGMVVTGALRHVGDRVRELVFLDAFVPADGQSVLDLLGRPEPPALEVGAPWSLEPTDRDFDDPVEAAFARPRRTPQPAATFAEPVRLPRPLEQWDFGLTYVKATGDARGARGGAAFWDAADRARASAAWRYREVDTNHMIASNRPQALAAILLELAPG